jgi:hypothetical protein
VKRYSSEIATKLGRKIFGIFWNGTENFMRRNNEI